MLPLAQVAVTLWAVVVGIWDRKERRIPNWLVLPVVAALLIWRVYEAIVTRSASQLALVLVVWIVLFMIWQAHFYGGGDAKFLMALFGFFPTLQFLLLLCLVVVLTRLPLIIYRFFKKRSADGVTTVSEQRVHWLPTAADLQSKGLPNSWTFALAGVIYVWWLY